MHAMETEGWSVPGVAMDMESKPTFERNSSSYSHRVDLGLRIAATMFTLLAFALLAGTSQIGDLLKIPAIQFIFAANIVSFVYCLASLAVVTFSVFLKLCGVTKIAQLTLCILDAVIGMLLAFSSGAFAGIISFTISLVEANSSDGTTDTSGYGQAQSAVAFGFVGTFCLVALTLLYAFSPRQID